MAEVTQLHLVRHAHAGNPARWAGPDEDRPLSEKGRRQAERLSDLFAAAGLAPDVILTSPKLRAVQTAEILARAIDQEVRIEPRLGGGVDLATLAAILADAGSPAQPMLVGHDPDFSDLASDLVGAALAMRKGALARIDLTGPPQPGAGVLRWLLPPDVLGR